MAHRWSRPPSKRWDYRLADLQRDMRRELRGEYVDSSVVDIPLSMLSLKAFDDAYIRPSMTTAAVFSACSTPPVVVKRFGPGVPKGYSSYWPRKDDFTCGYFFHPLTNADPELRIECGSRWAWRDKRHTARCSECTAEMLNYFDRFAD